MATGFEPKTRNVIPRWRDFSTTLELGELSIAASRREVTSPKFQLQQLEDDWRGGRTISFAADLISAAVISGGSDVAREAAEQVIIAGLEKAGEQLYKLANSVLDRGIGDQSTVNLLQVHSKEELARSVRNYRQRLAISSRNAILWVDLSLLYATQGHKDQAKRAMMIAVGLEPNNRFVLRSAARLLIHRGEPDLAHRLLRRSEAIRNDPWIMSAELATATSAKFLTFSVDDAVRLLNSDNLPARETTELSAAMATLELNDGSTTKAKRHLRKGLREPNENSFAQVRWLQRDLKGFLPELHITGIQRSFEASMWESHSKQDWATATLCAVRWFKDQPFSSRPAVIGANISAGVLEDYSAAISFATQGLVSNPTDNILHSLIAFAHASKGELSEAREALSQIKGQITPNVEVTTKANFGLIAFREGKAEIGRSLYEEAYQKAIGFENNDLAAGALAYWAREEILIDSPAAQQILGRAREAADKLGDKNIETRAVLALIEKKFIQKAKVD